VDKDQLEAVIEANRPRLEESVRRGEEQLASGDPLPTLDEVIGLDEASRHGRHSDEAAEARGVWYRWHDGSAVGSVPGFRHGGKAAGLT
jgi:hypothetical protein